MKWVRAIAGVAYVILTGLWQRAADVVRPPHRGGPPAEDSGTAGTQDGMLNEGNRPAKKGRE